MTLIGLAAGRQRTPASQVLAAQSRQRFQHCLAPLHQVLVIRAPRGLAGDFPSKPGAVERQRAIAAVLYHRERIAEQRGAIDLHGIGRHAPAPGTAKLHATWFPHDVRSAV